MGRRAAAGLITIAPVGLVGNVAKGTLSQVYRGTPPFLLVKPTDAEKPLGYWGGDRVEDYQGGPEGQPTPSSLDAIQVGDYVELSLDAQDQIMKVMYTRTTARGGLPASVAAASCWTAASCSTWRRTWSARRRTAARTTSASCSAETMSRSPTTRGSNTALKIVVNLVGGAPVQPSGRPEIVLVEPDYRGAVGAGGQLTVRLRGTAKGVPASTSATGSRGCRCKSGGGDYRGAYLVKPGDDVTGAPVIGNLRVGQTSVSPTRAETLVTIDTTPPTFLSVARAICSRSTPRLRASAWSMRMAMAVALTRQECG